MGTWVTWNPVDRGVVDPVWGGRSGASSAMTASCTAISTFALPTQVLMGYPNIWFLHVNHQQIPKTGLKHPTHQACSKGEKLGLNLAKSLHLWLLSLVLGASGAGCEGLKVGEEILGHWTSAPSAI